MEKKMWTRADARAEMNRIAKECADALTVLRTAATKIAALSVETGFHDDAASALKALRDRAYAAMFGTTREK